MSLTSLMRTAWSSIGGNLLRTTLTLLGIVIGVAAVISTMSVGRGAALTVTETIETLGSDLLFVRPLMTATGTSNLTLGDSLALVDPVFSPSIAAVAPELSFNATVVAQGTDIFIQALGVTMEYAEVRNFEVADGQFISPAHVINRSNVVVLGAQTAEDLFWQRDPVGSEIQINERQFTVIGILETKGSRAFGNEDDRLLIPITNASARFSASEPDTQDISISAINVKAHPGTAEYAMTEALMVLRLRHQITDQDDFTISNQADVISTLNDITDTFTVFLGAIAAISLAVGGIGIMNIMLVSVTERTREIGIRKALGAKRQDILAQFVTEAVLLSLGGGAIGVGGGFLVSRLLNGVELGTQTLRTVFSGDIAILALIVSAGIGLFFGIYPALRAAQMHPIDALRYE